MGKVKAVVCRWNGHCVGNGMMIYGEVNLYHVFIFDDIGDSAECDFIWEHRVGLFSVSGIAVLKVYEYLKV